MKLIIGLGNPGPEYKQTRHNVGFLLLDTLAKEWGGEFQDKPRFKAMIAEVTVGNEKLLLIKPQTFYNLSGEAVRAIRDFYKLTNDDILTIADEMALPFGTIRTRIGGTDAGNNGIASLIQHLGPDFARIRVGTWTEQRSGGSASDFVLGKLSALEQEVLGNQITKVITQAVDAFASQQFVSETVQIDLATPQTELPRT